jgi:hypothetical protein
MSFLYRPTPVVNLGSGPFASTRVFSGWTTATMRGIPAGAGALGAAGPTGAVSRMRRVDTRMQPWLKASGTMGSFIPNGLGQDDGSGIDWSTAGDISPNLPDFIPPPDLVPPDLGSPSFSPNLPALISPGAPPAPPFSAFGNPGMVPPNLPILTPPRPGAGPTGSGIPGTQPLNPVLPAVSAGAGLLNTIKSFFSPSPATQNYKTLPGYGGGVAAPPASAGILPGVSNTTLLLGVGAFVLVMAMSSGGKK